MGKRKTELDYREDLLTAYKARQKNPQSSKLNKTLETIQKVWADRVSMVFYIANNEQLPYTTKEVGYPCLKMPTEKVSGHYQVGDVVCYLPEHGIITSVAWDRKGGGKPNPFAYHLNKFGKRVYPDVVNYGATDWYGTIMGTHKIKGDDNKVIEENNIDRFVRECTRAKKECFTMMLVGIECTESQFFAYRPNGNAGAVLSARRRRSESLLQKTGGFAHIMYLGSRENAIATMIRQNQFWIRYNYETVLKL